MSTGLWGDKTDLEGPNDIPFGSPSAASAVIFGRPDNGRTSWLVKETGQTYADWTQDQIEKVSEILSDRR